MSRVDPDGVANSLPAGEIRDEQVAAMDRPVTASGPHRDDVLLAKVLRVRARLGLIDGHKIVTAQFPTEIRLLDEVIEELTLDDD